jgi:hypothetical protein
VVAHRPAHSTFTGGRIGSIRDHISSVNTSERVICEASALRPAQHWDTP